MFINGFEAGGYQASLWSIGKDFDLSKTSMGLYAAMELFATMLAPILLGRWADSVEKVRSIALMLGIQIAAAMIALNTASNGLFLFSVFFLGLTTSALQFISIAALADAYPVSGGKKVAYITTMYALGALLSPLVVDFYLRRGLGWRTLFGLLAAGSVLALCGMLLSGSKQREEKASTMAVQGGGARFVLSAILSSPAVVMLLCVPLGLASGAIYPSILTIVLPFAGKKTATATGIITAATGIGGVVFTAMTGFLADALGMRAAMLVLVSFFALSLLSALIVIRQSKGENEMS